MYTCIYTLADSTKTIHLKSRSSGVGASPLYESIHVPSSATVAGDRNKYESVELRSSTQHESAAAARYEEIELSSNAAYARFCR